MQVDAHELILRAAVILSTRDGYANITRDQIAEFAGVASGTVTYHFGDMNALRAAVMRFAVDKEVLKIVADGLADGNLIARKASDQLKRRAAMSITR